jgi:hypothetical protein
MRSKGGRGDTELPKPDPNRQWFDHDPNGFTNGFPSIPDILAF